MTECWRGPEYYLTVFHPPSPPCQVWVSTLARLSITAASNTLATDAGMPWHWLAYCTQACDVVCVMYVCASLMASQLHNLDG